MFGRGPPTGRTVVEDLAVRAHDLGPDWGVYPAVDLCAGEKERGTLETLLSSPAARMEIVWGKLLTVMSFSMATSMLNLIA